MWGPIILESFVDQLDTKARCIIMYKNHFHEIKGDIGMSKQQKRLQQEEISSAVIVNDYMY